MARTLIFAETHNAQIKTVKVVSLARVTWSRLDEAVKIRLNCEVSENLRYSPDSFSKSR